MIKNSSWKSALVICDLIKQRRAHILQKEMRLEVYFINEIVIFAVYFAYIWPGPWNSFIAIFVMLFHAPRQKIAFRDFSIDFISW